MEVNRIISRDSLDVGALRALPQQGMSGRTELNKRVINAVECKVKAICALAIG